MTTGNNELILPSDKVLKHVAKLAIEQDKPIMMDYWMDSYGDSPSVLIGVRNNETEEKLLVRSNEEYTSPISKIQSKSRIYYCNRKFYLCCKHPNSYKTYIVNIIYIMYFFIQNIIFFE